MTLEDVIAAALQYPQVAVRLKNVLRSDLVVGNVFERQICEFLADFFDRYDQVPKQGDWEAWVEELPERDQDAIRDALRDLLSRDLSQYTPEFVADHAGEVLKESASRTAIGRLGQLDSNRLESLRETMEEIESIEPISIGGLANLREVDKWLHPTQREERVRSGIDGLDATVGGWGQELIMVLADAKVGKSIALCNFGAVAGLHGSNVLHITLEIRRDRQAVRYYRRMTESDRYRVRKDPSGVRDDVRHWWKFAQGEIHLLYKDAHTVTPEDLRALIRTHKELYWQPDVIILDYLDLLAPSEKVARQRVYKQLGYSSHQVRALCDEYEATVLTATQATRPSGEYIEFLSLSQMGDSYEKVRAADLILGLVQTPEEEERHQARIQILATRDSPGQGSTIEVFFEKDRMLLRDLNHPDTRRIMREMGMDVPAMKEED